MTTFVNLTVGESMPPYGTSNHAGLAALPQILFARPFESTGFAKLDKLREDLKPKYQVQDLIGTVSEIDLTQAHNIKMVVAYIDGWESDICSVVRSLLAIRRSLPVILVGNEGEVPAKIEEVFRDFNFFYLSLHRLTKKLLNDTIATAFHFPARISGESNSDKVLEKNDTALKDFIVNHQDGMMIVNRYGSVLYANRACCDILGKKYEELRGRFYQLPSTFEHLSKIVIPRKGKESVPVTVRKTKIRWDSQPAYWITFQDATRFFKRLSALESEKKQAEKKAKAQAIMISNMSHEMRTPLTSILGLAQSLEEGAVPDEKQRHDFVKKIRSNGQHLLRLVNDILDIEKTQGGQVRLELGKTSMPQIEAYIRDRIDFHGVQSGVKVGLDGFEDTRDLYTDVARLKQIVDNIVTNALKYTESGSIYIRVIEQSAIDLRIEVEDSGLGIPQDKWEDIFTPFVQLGDKNWGAKSGSGLGLPLARNLARHLGGDLRVKNSIVGKGSTFEMRIATNLCLGPRVFDRESEPKKVGSSMRQDATLRGKRILAIDDCEDILFLLEHQLSHLKAEVSTARSGNEALAQIRANEFDVVLLDIRLGDESGYDVCSAIREAGYEGCILALSADAQEGSDLQRFRRVGLDGYITKPVEMKKLARYICGHID